MSETVETSTAADAQVGRAVAGAAATTSIDSLRARLADFAPEAASRPAAIEIVRAPGRVNLIGEYTDINDGFVLPVAIDREVRIALLATDDRRVSLRRLDSGETGSFDLDALPPRSGGWLDYAVGTAWALGRAGLPTRGLRGVIGSNLPVGAGLSSSAAIELAVAHALLGEHAAAIAPLELARLAQRAENQFVGVQCGLMDQFAASCGNPGGGLLLDCRTHDWRPVGLPLDEVRLVVCDTGSPRRLSASEYNVRRAQCEEAVAVLARDDPAIHALRDATLDAVRRAAAEGQLTPVVAGRAEHILTENERVLTTVAALEAGDLAAVGDAFAASHASLRDRFEVSSPALDALVEIAVATPGVVAARMTGAGFGGCTINIVRPDAVERLKTAVERDYQARTGYTPRVFEVSPAAGAGHVLEADTIG